jgi:hypothetical protein
MEKTLIFQDFSVINKDKYLNMFKKNYKIM